MVSKSDKAMAEARTLNRLADEIRVSSEAFRVAFAEFIRSFGPRLIEAREIHATGEKGSDWGKWCRNELGWSQQHVGRLIAASKVIATIEPIGSGFPTSEIH